MSDLFRVYLEAGPDGYPPEWHATIKHAVREEGGHRCERCGHPYRKGAGHWSHCDDRCHHPGPVTVGVFGVPVVFAEWRILTVHHLNGDKLDCRWWNLASLCQRCHLRVQRVVEMGRVWPWAHSPWFEPHASGWYAHAYLGEDLTREETMARRDELLALERIA